MGLDNFLEQQEFLQYMESKEEISLHILLNQIQVMFCFLIKVYGIQFTMDFLEEDILQ